MRVLEIPLPCCNVYANKYSGMPKCKWGCRGDEHNDLELLEEVLWIHCSLFCSFVDLFLEITRTWIAKTSVDLLATRNTIFMIITTATIMTVTWITTPNHHHRCRLPLTTHYTTCHAHSCHIHTTLCMTSHHHSPTRTQCQKERYPLAGLSFTHLIPWTLGQSAVPSLPCARQCS